MFRIGSFCIDNPTILAPMAGVTDLPFRQLCRRFGAGMTVSEMVTSDTRLWSTQKSRLRLPHAEEPEPRIIQIAGSDPEMLANAASANAALGAQIIDINMGCPAKKVCRKAAGSALLQDEALVARILKAVVAAVEIPVTLKIRTGWNLDNRNGAAIAHIAEQEGIQALAVHGRTRACKFKGAVDYDTIAAIVSSVKIPVFANGDITTPLQAKNILDNTGAAAIMIGRGAQGRPWIFREINHFLSTGVELSPPTLIEIRTTLTDHLIKLHNHYGDFMGLRIARKHVGWYLQTLETSQANTATFRRQFNALESAQAQLDALSHFFNHTNNIQEQAA